MTNAQRLDHVEDELEIVKQLLLSAASYAESANEKIDRLGTKVDEMANAQLRTQAQLGQLSERVDSFIFNTQRLFTQQATVLERLEENQRTNNAALERIDRILDYLLRQQGNNH